MKRLAVIGYPIEHSVSPPMQQTALDGCGIDAVYEKQRVAPEELAAFVAELRGGGWLGVNVTVPHKESILPMMDELSPAASAIGAVNTVVVAGRRLVGHNTDAPGFLASLREEGGSNPAGSDVVVLGAGGAARAVTWALVSAEAAGVTLFNRGFERAQRLAETAATWRTGCRVEAESWEDGRLASRLEDCHLLVNATSVGLGSEETPVPAGLIPPGVLVVDVIYSPRPTRLLREASARGARSLDGLAMLVHQGAEAFRLWTGKDAPFAAMYEAAERALER